MCSAIDVASGGSIFGLFCMDGFFLVGRFFVPPHQLPLHCCLGTDGMVHIGMHYAIHFFVSSVRFQETGRLARQSRCGSCGAGAFWICVGSVVVHLEELLAGECLAEYVRGGKVTGRERFRAVYGVTFYVQFATRHDCPLLFRYRVAHRDRVL